MSINTTLRYIILGGIFLVPFIPFIVTSSMFFPFITGKNFTFRILTELLFGGWLILALRHSAYRLKFSWIAVSVAVFVGVIALADFLGENPFKSFWSNFERMEGLVTLIHLLLYFLAVGTVLNTEKLWNRLFNTSIAVSVVLGIYGLFQLAGKVVINQGGTRLDATFGNATYLAIYMLFHVFLTTIMLVRWRGHGFVRFFYGAAIFLQLFILYNTATRGAILGVLGGALLTAILVVVFEREHRFLRYSALSILVGVLMIIGGFFVAKDSAFITESPVLSRLASISLEEESNTRFIIWSMARQGIQERPLLGWGQENFNYVFNTYYDPRLYDQEPWFDRVHDLVLDWLIAGGILGFLAYFSMPLILLYYLWWRTERLSVVEKSLFTGMLAGYGFHNLFVFDNLISYILFFTILAYIHYSNGGEFPKATPRISLEEGMRTRVFPALIIILVIGSLYFFNTKGIVASRTLINALTPQQGGLEVNLSFFDTALAYNSFGRQEIIEQLVTTATQMRNGDVDLAIQTKYFERAKTEIEQLIEDYPNDTRLQLFLATFINRFGLYDEAIVRLERAIELSPQKQTIHFELGAAYLNKGDAVKAFEIFEHAYNLDTNYQDARFIYAVGAIYAGRIDIADGIMDAMFVEFDEKQTGFRIDDRVVRAYPSVGRIDAVAALWQKAIERQPKVPEYHRSLAATYIQLGAREKAIEELEVVIALDPGFKEQGEFFISEIKAGRNP